MSGRNSVLRGNEISLTIIFLNAVGDRTDPDSDTLNLNIFPPGFDPRLDDDVSNAWVYGVTLTSGGAGPYADAEVHIERLDTGSYSYTFMIPDDAELGAGFDQWTATIDDEDLDETFSFVIVGGGSIGSTQLYENNMVFIRLGSTIAAADGSLLGEAFESYFTTTYNPLYTSVRRIRADVGSLISGVPDDTINLHIFESSLEADALVFSTLTGLTSSQINFFNFARRQFVTCLTELTLLGAIAGQGGVTGQKQKRLADLEVRSAAGVGKLDDLLERALACKIKWEATLSSAAEVGPNTSSRPSMVVKGSSDPDRPMIGRGYSTRNGQYPAANTKYIPRWHRRARKGYTPTSRWDV